MATNGTCNGFHSEKNIESSGSDVKPGSCVLLTGGTGFIGSHAVVEVVNAGYDAVVVDNLCNSNQDSIERVEKITGKTVPFYQVDILDSAGLREVFTRTDANDNIDGVKSHEPEETSVASVTSGTTGTTGSSVKPGSCVLLTGGAGFIGSHTVIEVINAGYRAVVVDNLCNSNRESIQRIERITGSTIPFYEVDILDTAGLRGVFARHQFSAVMHFAGYKAVGESYEKPFEYYMNNLQGTLSLLQVMKEFGVYNIVFSSSCTVYGAQQFLPADESHPTGNCNCPYGRTKYFIEQILYDICNTDKHWNAVLLRYFNPVGAHPSGLIGEDPLGVPNNLMPFISQVAVGRREKLRVFGNDYDTPDGTCVRDYIHVVDLACGHVAALKQIAADCNIKAYNLGTGVGYSVLEVLKAFEAASGKEIPYEIVSRRRGDVATIYGKPALAEKELEWKATRGLKEMCEDTWKWQSLNPAGYLTSENSELSKSQ